MMFPIGNGIINFPLPAKVMLSPRGNSIKQEDAEEIYREDFKDRRYGVSGQLISVAARAGREKRPRSRND